MGRFKKPVQETNTDERYEEESAEEQVEALHTESSWQGLDRTKWADQSMVSVKSGEPKEYLLFWHDDMLYVQMEKTSFALPSIEGGLRWGVPGPRNELPRFTLAFEDAEEDRLTWRNFNDGETSHVWLLEDTDVDFEPRLPRKKGQGKGERRAQGRSQTQDQDERKPQGRNRAGAERRRGQRKGTEKAPGDDNAVTDEAYRSLGGTLWVDEVEENPEGGMKTYEIRWEGAALHVTVNGRSSFPMPSIDGGLRWGTGGRRQANPKFTLADEDMEEEKLTWRRFEDGEVANVWILEDAGK